MLEALFLKALVLLLALINSFNFIIEKKELLNYMTSNTIYSSSHSRNLSNNLTF